MPLCFTIILVWNSVQLSVKAYVDFVAPCWCSYYLCTTNNWMASLQWGGFIWLFGVVDSLVHILPSVSLSHHQFQTAWYFWDVLLLLKLS